MSALKYHLPIVKSMAGAGAMALYKLYEIIQGNRIAGPPRYVEMENDDLAAEWARQLLDGKPIEIWDHQRLVGRVDPTPDGEAPDLEHKPRF